MPARKEEVHHAKEEGIEFMLLTNPVKVLDDGTGRVGGLECVKMQPRRAPDESGRRAPKVVEGSNFDPGGGHRGHEPGHQPQPPDPLHHPRPGDQPEGLPPGRRRGNHGRPAAPASMPAATPSPARPPSSWPWAPARRPPSPCTSTFRRSTASKHRQAEEGRPDGVALLILERRGQMPAPHAYGFFTWCRRYGHRRRPGRGRCSHGR